MHDYTISSIDAGHDDLRGQLVVTLHSPLDGASLRRLDNALDTPASVTDGGARRVYWSPARSPREHMVSLATTVLDILYGRVATIWVHCGDGFVAIEHLRAEDDAAEILGFYRDGDQVGESYFVTRPGQSPEAAFALIN